MVNRPVIPSGIFVGADLVSAPSGIGNAADAPSTGGGGEPRPYTDPRRDDNG